MTEEVFAKIQVVREITKQQVQNLLVGLLENGYSSWFLRTKILNLADGLSKADFMPGGKFEDKEYGRSLCFIVPFHPNCSLTIEVENPVAEGALNFQINENSIRNGLELLAQKDPKQFNSIIDGNDDAETADLFGQLMVYGESVYC